MMRSFGQLVEDYKTKSGNADSANKTFGQVEINESDKHILGARPWQFLEDTQEITTTANGSAYQLKAKTTKVLSLRDSTNNYEPPTPITDPDKWERLQALNAASSDVTEHYRVIGTKLEVWPAYSTAGSTLVARHIKTRKDMTQDDYTTGTITSIANGAKAVVGSGTSWTQKFVGRWIQFSGTSGDDLWYEVASVTDATHLSLVKNYEGTSIAAATDTYRIGEMSLIPGDFLELPLYRALAIYFEQHELAAQAKRYWQLYDGGYELGLRDEPGGLFKKMIDAYGDFDDSPFISPARADQPRDVNDPPTNLTGF